MERHRLPDWLCAGLAVISVFVLALASLMAGRAEAQELGHYGPALPDARDFVMPAKPGFYFKQYTYYYTADKFQDRNGETVSTIPLPGGATANLDVDVGIYVLAPAFMWVSDWEILGARYGAY